MKQYIIPAVIIISLVVFIAVLQALMPEKKGLSSVSVKWYASHIKMAATKSIKCRKKQKLGEEMDALEQLNCSHAKEACEDSYGACENYGYVY